MHKFQLQTFFIITFLFVSGCVSSKIETTPVDMTNLDIYEFEELDKPCSQNNHCKVIKTKLYSCGNYDTLLYSSIVVNGNNEKHLFKLSKNSIAASKKKIPSSQECNGSARTPTVGVCWKNECEIIRTWR